MRPPIPKEYSPFLPDPPDDQGSHSDINPRLLATPAARRLGLWIFLASLIMLFAASIWGYVYIRITGSNSPDSGTLNIPIGLYLSTMILIASGVTIHLTTRSAEQYNPTKTKRLLAATLLLAIAFIIAQSPALAELLNEHNRALSSHYGLYGMLFFLVILHALHVLGGILPLAWLILKPNPPAVSLNQESPAAHPSATTIRLTATYWHFLEAVWISMFIVFILTQ